MRRFRKKKKRRGRKQVKKKKPLFKRILAAKELYLLLIPGLVWYLLLHTVPMTELRIAFYDYNVFQGIEGSTFVGLDNFIEFFYRKGFF